MLKEQLQVKSFYYEQIYFLFKSFFSQMSETG